MVSYRIVKCYLAVVRFLQIDLGLGDPLTTTPRLEHVFRGIKRSQASTAHARPPFLAVTRDLIMLLIHSHLNLTDPIVQCSGQPSRQPGLVSCASANAPPRPLALIRPFTYPSVTWQWTAITGPLACLFLSRLPRQTASAGASGCLFLKLVARQ